jgi:hypothetical protein
MKTLKVFKTTEYVQKEFSIRFYHGEENMFIEKNLSNGKKQCVFLDKQELSFLIEVIKEIRL